MSRLARLSVPAGLLTVLALLPGCGPSDVGRTPNAGAVGDHSATAQQARVDAARADTTDVDSIEGVETAIATQPAAEQDTAVQSAAGTGVLMRFNLRGAPTRQLQLSAELREISGIAFDARGRLFAHGDENGTIWQLDPSKGTVLKSFALAAPTATAATDGAAAKGDGGKKHHKKGGKDGGEGGKKAAEAAADGTVHADFEDIQVVGDRIYLIASTGQLYETREGADGERVPFTLIDTGLGAKCEIEGMSYDEASRALLLLCKHASVAEWRDKVVVVGFSLARRQLEAKPRLVVDYADLARVTGAKAFHGSALVRAPRTGTFVMIAGPQETYAEVSSTGRVLGGGRLDRRYHRQPEGLAFAPDGSLLMSDEAAGKTATLSVYTARP
jgi:hypothetical protein